MDTIIGRFAFSKAGRDSGKLLIITGMVDENHVLVCDGCLRRLGKPKKKKLKHLELTQHQDDEIVLLCRTRRRMTDADIRSAIGRYVQRQAEEALDGEE